MSDSDVGVSPDCPRPVIQIQKKARGLIRTSRSVLAINSTSQKYKSNMLKSVVSCIILWHGMCEFSSRAHPASTDSRILDLPALNSPKINDTDEQIEPRVIQNFYTNYFNITQIFYINGFKFETTAPTTAPTIAPTTTPTIAPTTAPTIAPTTTPTTSSTYSWYSFPGYTVTNGIGAHRLHTEKRTWSQARQICIDEGGDLAVIKSDAEENIVNHLAMKDIGYAHWIGFHKPLWRQDWVSVFSETLVKNGWAHWLPDLPQAGELEKCIGYVHDAKRKRGMMALECDATRRFICKITTI